MFSQMGAKPCGQNWLLWPRGPWLSAPKYAAVHGGWTRAPKMRAPNEYKGVSRIGSWGGQDQGREAPENWSRVKLESKARARELKAKL